MIEPAGRAEMVVLGGREGWRTSASRGSSRVMIAPSEREGRICVGMSILGIAVSAMVLELNAGAECGL